MKTPIYPNVEISSYDCPDSPLPYRYCSISSMLRVLGRDGRWYLTFKKNEHRFEKYNLVLLEKVQIEALNKFHSEVYFYTHLVITDNDAKHLSGENMFQLDRDQSSESERLLKIINA